MFYNFWHLFSLRTISVIRHYWRMLWPHWLTLSVSEAAFRCWMSGCKLREEFLAQRLSSGKLKINMSAEKCFHSSIWFTESSELSDELPDISHYSWCLMQRLLPCWFYCLVKCYLMCVFVFRFWQYSEIKSNTAFNSLQEQEIKLIICKNHTHTHTNVNCVCMMSE